VVGITPYGAVQFQDFYTPAYSETDVTGGGFGLTYNATNATDVRTELGGRFDDPAVVYGKPLALFGRVAWAHDFVSDPARSAGFQALPGRHLHGQRRADPARLGADHRRGATFPDVAMDLACQVRGRVRQRLTDLRRHGHAALCVVSDLIEPPLSLIGPSRPIAALQFFGCYWGRSGHRDALESEGSVANDPNRTLTIDSAQIGSFRSHG
jgi:hypothetical protein